MKALLLILALCFTLHGQQYGKPSDLKGLHKVFVDTGDDIKNRERILKEIEKAKLDIELLDDAEGAEIILHFGGDKEKYLSRINTDQNGGQLVYKSKNTGQGAVYVVKDGKLRTVLSFDDVERNMFEKKPATNFAKTFIKAYKKANGL